MPTDTKPDTTKPPVLPPPADPSFVEISRRVSQELDAAGLISKAKPGVDVQSDRNALTVSFHLAGREHEGPKTATVPRDHLTNHPMRAVEAVVKAAVERAAAEPAGTVPKPPAPAEPGRPNAPATPAPAPAGTGTPPAPPAK